MPKQAVSSEQPGASMVEVSSSERDGRGEGCRGSPVTKGSLESTRKRQMLGESP